MSFRNLDENHDWTFGSGISNYATESKETALNLKTRILSFLGDCFFAQDEGIDWFNRLEYNQQNKLEIELNDVIVKTPDVVKINNSQVYVDKDRNYHAEYDIVDKYSKTITNTIKII